jgi:hypothetical protein
MAALQARLHAMADISRNNSNSSSASAAAAADLAAATVSALLAHLEWHHRAQVRLLHGCQGVLGARACGR